MVVILWAVRPTENRDSPHRFENHREHQVIYTTTHDTDTLRGHFPDREPWELIELALSSRPALCMIPAQDVLGLGSEGRMNTPGEPLGNWAWRLEQGQLTAALAERLRAATAASRRVASLGRFDRQAARHRALTAAAVDHVDDVVLPVGARGAEHDRRPAPEAELSLLAQLAGEDERPVLDAEVGVLALKRRRSRRPRTAAPPRRAARRGFHCAPPWSRS